MDFGTGEYGNNIVIMLLDEGAYRFNELKGNDPNLYAPDRI